MSGGPLPSSRVFNTDLNPILLGWVAFSWFGSTLAYVSADAPTFVFSVNADVTAIVEPGMRVKLTQTTDKFFIVTAVGAFSAGVTPITVYGGTDYTLANAAITAGSFSTHKKPFGFNASPAKWTETLIDTTSRSQASAVAGTWYNPGGLLLAVPIGLWSLGYRCVSASLTSGLTMYVTLSSANNSESDSSRTVRIVAQASGACDDNGRERDVAVTVKTSYFLNVKTDTGGSPTIYSGQGAPPTIIRAVCAYL